MRSGCGRRQPVERAIALGAAAALAALSACDPGGEAGNGGRGPSTGAAQRPAEVRPGLWEVESAIVAVSEPGLPHEIAGRMKGPRPTVRRCLTPEEAERPAAILLPASRAGRCGDEAFARRGNGIEGSAVCRDSSGAETRLRVAGRYGAEAYRVRTRVETPGIGARQTMTMVIEQSGRRIGDCPAGGGEGR